MPSILWADDEIDQELLCEIDPDDKKMGIFSERLLDCEELEEQRKIQSGDIYTTDVTLAKGVSDVDRIPYSTSFTKACV